jgi:hypothetical protein
LFTHFSLAVRAVKARAFTPERYRPLNSLCLSNKAG